MELLICDDSSQDNSCLVIEDWIRSYGSLFQKCTFIKHEKNHGITNTINELISIASGEIISGVASDDYVLPGGIEAKTKYLQTNPNILGAFSDAIAIGLHGQSYCDSILDMSGLTPCELAPNNIRKTILHRWVEPMNLQFWRRSAFKSHGGEFEFDGSIFCEDLNFALWALSKNSFGYLNHKCVAYRYRTWPQSSPNQSSTFIRGKYADMSICFDRASTLYKGREYDYMKNKSLFLMAYAVDNRYLSNKYHILVSNGAINKLSIIFKNIIRFIFLIKNLVFRNP